MLRAFSKFLMLLPHHLPLIQTVSMVFKHRRVSTVRNLADAARTGSVLVQLVIWTSPAVNKVNTMLWRRHLRRGTERWSSEIRIRLLAISMVLLAAEVQIESEIDESLGE